ncbi:flavin reductase [Demequina sp.]|uniref:flavin reductase family protein n=1 Tax=Demequina sp. TaxID=2050685 RepID=UPI0025C0528B|nr:flavin reductase [Demequina sp.]
MNSTANGHVPIRPGVLYVGTPVIFVCTQNADGSANLMERPELTVNFPSPEHWSAVEAMGDVTGMEIVPAGKSARYRHHADKFALARLSAEPSEMVAPPRVAECALQFEATVERATRGVGDYFMVEAHVERVHAAPRIVVDGTDHVNPRTWQPLIYAFRHYFALGRELGYRPSSALAVLDPQQG